MTEIAGKLFTWINTRLPIVNTFERHLSKHPVPSKVNFWYLFGALAAVKLDVSKMQYGQQIQVSWRKQPVFIVRHTKDSIASLDLALPKLADPNSDQIEEPCRGLNPSRSKSPEYSVFSGVCTHLGCAPKYFPEIEP